MRDKVSFRQVIKNRGFRYLWLNQVLVQLAYNTLNFALIIWVFKLVDSNLAISALMLTIYLPSVIFGLFAGIIVDLVDRRRIIIFIDLFLAVAFIFFIFIKAYYPLILINTFIINSLAQAFMPTESSSIPLLVPKKHLFLANSLFSLTLYGALMTGYSIGGPLLNHLGINSVFFLGAGLLLIACLLSQSLPVIKTVHANKQSGQAFLSLSFKKLFRFILSEGLVTFRFIRGKLNIATAIVLMSLVQGVIGMLAVMMPSYMEKVLKIHATDSSYFLMLPLGTGTILGAIVIGRFLHRLPRRSIVVPAIVGAGVLFILIGLAPAIAKLLIAADLPDYITRPRYFIKAPSLSFFFGAGAFLLGFCTAGIIIPCQTILQEGANNKNRGKIFAVLAAAMTGFSAVPVIAAGVLSDLFGVIPIFIGLGVIIFLVGLFATRPSWFFEESRLSFQWKEFLGLGHWEK